MSSPNVAPFYRQIWGAEPFKVLAPGLGLVAVAAGLSFFIHTLLGSVSALTVAVLIGALLSNTGKIPGVCFAGIQWAAKKLLRLGVVLLGLRLTLSDMGKLGSKGIFLVITVVAVTFFGTQLLAKRLGLSSSLGLLVATGFSICGASAVAAMKGVTPEATEEDVVYSVALVTLCGSLAIITLPLVGKWIGLNGAALGSWIGASVHDVAQTIATASAAGGGEDVKKAATVVKLTRVVMLAPLVIGVTMQRRRAAARAVSATPGGFDPGENATRPPILPLFVACFLSMILVRSTGIVPKNVLAGLKLVETLLFAAALVGLGVGVRLDKLRRVGPKPLVLGLLSWALIAIVSAIGVKLLNI